MQSNKKIQIKSKAQHNPVDVQFDKPYLSKLPMNDNLPQTSMYEQISKMHFNLLLLV